MFGIQRLDRLGMGLTGGALYLHQAPRRHHQTGIRGAERLGHHLFWLGEKVPGIDQVGRRLQGRCRTDASQDGGHAVRVGQGFFAGVQRLTGQQGLGEGASAEHRRRLVGAGVHLQQRHDGRGAQCAAL